MYYVYVIKSLKEASQFYTGYTKNLENRLKTHNTGGSPHTAKYIPWEIVVYMAFKDELSAISFEKYLKTGSGRVFMEKRFFYSLR